MCLSSAINNTCHYRPLVLRDQPSSNRCSSFLSPHILLIPLLSQNTPLFLTAMSLKHKHVCGQKSKSSLLSTNRDATSSSSSSAPNEIRTTWDIKRAHNHRTVPTVTPRGIFGTYTFSGVPGTSRSSNAASTGASTGASRLDTDPAHFDDGDMHQQFDDGVVHPHQDSPAAAATSEHLLNTTRQNDTWTRKVIPSLVPIYLHLLRTTQSLTHPPIKYDRLCTCGGKVTTITISCLYFDGEFSFIPMYLI